LGRKENSRKRMTDQKIRLTIIDLIRFKEENRIEKNPLGTDLLMKQTPVITDRMG